MSKVFRPGSSRTDLQKQVEETKEPVVATEASLPNNLKGITQLFAASQLNMRQQLDWDKLQAQLAEMIDQLMETWNKALIKFGFKEDVTANQESETVAAIDFSQGGPVGPEQAVLLTKLPFGAELPKNESILEAMKFYSGLDESAQLALREDLMVLGSIDSTLALEATEGQNPDFERYHEGLRNFYDGMINEVVSSPEEYAAKFDKYRDATGGFSNVPVGENTLIFYEKMGVSQPEYTLTKEVASPEVKPALPAAQQELVDSLKASEAKAGLKNQIHKSAGSSYDSELAI